MTRTNWNSKSIMMKTTRNDKQKHDTNMEKNEVRNTIETGKLKLNMGKTNKPNFKTNDSTRNLFQWLIVIPHLLRYDYGVCIFCY